MRGFRSASSRRVGHVAATGRTLASAGASGPRGSKCARRESGALARSCSQAPQATACLSNRVPANRLCSITPFYLAPRSACARMRAPVLPPDLAARAEGRRDDAAGALGRAVADWAQRSRPTGLRVAQDCEITDPAGHPVIVMRQDNPEGRSDRRSTRNQEKEEGPRVRREQRQHQESVPALRDREINLLSLAGSVR